MNGLNFEVLKNYDEQIKEWMENRIAEIPKEESGYKAVYSTFTPEQQTESVTLKFDFKPLAMFFACQDKEDVIEGAVTPTGQKTNTRIIQAYSFVWGGGIAEMGMGMNEIHLITKGNERIHTTHTLLNEEPVLVDDHYEITFYKTTDTSEFIFAPRKYWYLAVG